MESRISKGNYICSIGDLPTISSLLIVFHHFHCQDLYSSTASLTAAKRKVQEHLCFASCERDELDRVVRAEDRQVTKQATNKQFNYFSEFAAYVKQC